MIEYMFKEQFILVEHKTKCIGTMNFIFGVQTTCGLCILFQSPVMNFHERFLQNG